MFSTDEFLAHIDSLRGKKADPESLEEDIPLSQLTYQALHEALPLSSQEALAFPDERNNIHTSGTMRAKSADDITEGLRAVIGSSNASVLVHVGCSTGVNSTHFLPVADTVIGIDVNANAISIGKSNELNVLDRNVSLHPARGYSLHHCNLMQTDGFPSGSVVVAYNVAFGVDNFDLAIRVAVSDVIAAVLYGKMDLYDVFEKVRAVHAQIRGTASSGHNGHIYVRKVHFADARRIRSQSLMNLHAPFDAAYSREARTSLLRAALFKPLTDRSVKLKMSKAAAESAASQNSPRIPELLSSAFQEIESEVVDRDSAGNRLVDVFVANATVNIDGRHVSFECVSRANTRALYIENDSVLQKVNFDRSMHAIGTAVVCSSVQRVFVKGIYIILYIFQEVAKYNQTFL